MRADSAERKHTPSTIEPGVSGIWATCERGREAKCVTELSDLLEQVVLLPFVSVLFFSIIPTHPTCYPGNFLVTELAYQMYRARSS